MAIQSSMASNLPYYISRSASLTAPWSTAITHYCKSLEHFHPLEQDQRVFLETGAEQFALYVAESLPPSIETVETEHLCHFVKQVRVYVCVTPESFEDLTGRTVRAITYRGSIFLSPRLMENPETIPLYLTHELSHLIMMQRIGLYKFLTMPPWFSEGLAVIVSKGGGAQEVTEADAVNAILTGRHFAPHNAGGMVDLMSPRYGNYWDLSPHTFYRQASLFVFFMKEYNQESFRSLLLGIESGQPFEESFRHAYGMSSTEMWQVFTEHLKSRLENEANVVFHLPAPRVASLWGT